MSAKRKSSAEAAPSGKKQTADSGDDKAASTSDLSSTLDLSTPKLKKHKVQKAAETPMNGTTQSDVVEAKDRKFRGEPSDFNGHIEVSIIDRSVDLSDSIFRISRACECSARSAVTPKVFSGNSRRKTGAC